jgi:hypothetical protein
MNGACPLYALNSDINQQSDALASKFILYDLQKMGKVKFGGELVTNGDFSQGGTGWVVESGTWDFGNAKASIVCTAIYQAIYQNIPATPNTDYVLVGKLTNNARFFVRYLDASNNILGTTNILFSDGTVSFTTPSNCVKLVVRCDTSTATSGTFTFDDVSLKQVLKNGFTDAEAELLLRGLNPDPTQELVANGDFSQGSVGWTVGQGIWDLTNSNAKLTANAVGDTLNITNQINVLPNSQYRIIGDFDTTNTKLRVSCYTSTPSFISDIDITANDIIFMTPTNCGKITLRLMSKVTSGTFTFDNISLKFVRPAGLQVNHVLPKYTGTVAILSNNKYHIEGSATLSYNGVSSRVVTTGDIITKSYENKAVLSAGSTIQLKM